MVICLCMLGCQVHMAWKITWRHSVHISTLRTASKQWSGVSVLLVCYKLHAYKVHYMPRAVQFDNDGAVYHTHVVTCGSLVCGFKSSARIVNVAAGPDHTKPIVTSPAVKITPIVMSSASAKQDGCALVAAESQAVPVADIASQQAGMVSPEEPEAAEAGGPAAKRPRLGDEAEAAHTNGHASLANNQLEQLDGQAAPVHVGDAYDLVCYTLEMQSRPGKFDPKKAKALGVTPGPVSHLQRGMCPWHVSR